MASPIAANKAELLAIANAVASEKMIDKAIVVEALEEAIQRAARARYGAENDIRAKLDTQTGDLRLWRVVEVVEVVEDYFKQVDLKQAEKLQKGAAVGDFIVDPLPPVDLGRIDAQSAKQVIFQKVRDAERERQFEEFKDRAGEIITGVVKSVEFGHVVVDLGRAEGVIRRDQQIPREVVRPGDRVRALILKVVRENRGPQILLSRAHPDFMKKLFAQEVPEIYDGIIEIKAAARDPGSRAKIGVISYDSSIDPVGACVGMKGSRVQAVVQEMQGEKIDIIPWSEDAATFIVNALQPATVSRVVIDEEESAHRSCRSRRPAEPGHRPSRPECPSCQPADRPRDRHHDRGGIEREASEGICRAFGNVPAGTRRRRNAGAAACGRRLQRA
jgi:N utilization substance protein A